MILQIESINSHFGVQYITHCLYIEGRYHTMEILSSCKDAIRTCLESRSFSVAHLYTNEFPRNGAIHIHDNYEINFSVSGGKQFLIDRHVYPIQPGDIFFINQYESHFPAQADGQPHERIVLSVFPEYLNELSSSDTDLNCCFSMRSEGVGHRLSLTEEEQKQFLQYIRRLSALQGYGTDLLEKALFTELMVYLNQLFLRQADQNAQFCTRNEQFTSQTNQILSFIDSNLQAELTIELLSQKFFLSPSYLCRIFKAATGTTINKYISAKRISRAKLLLGTGHSVSETAELCGFRDYSNFLKTFSKTVGTTPKKYAQCSS